MCRSIAVGHVGVAIDTLMNDHRDQLFGTLPGAASVVPGARWRSRLCRDVQPIKIRSPHPVAQGLHTHLPLGIHP
jgi:hypothetical protein